jgi:hypothetical protein
MNLSSAAFISVVSSTALVGLSATTAYSNTTSSASHSFKVNDRSVQQSSMTVARNSVRGASLLLNIETSANSQMSGVVKVNGRAVADLAKSRSIDLTSCLRRATCEIDIVGNYKPQSFVKVKIYSTNNTMRSTFESTGSGILNQKLLINIT